MKKENTLVAVWPFLLGSLLSLALILSLPFIVRFFLWI